MNGKMNGDASHDVDVVMEDAENMSQKPAIQKG
jgi:hypothetical protein